MVLLVDGRFWDLMSYSGNIPFVRRSSSQVRASQIIRVVLSRNLIRSRLGRNVSWFGCLTWNCGPIFGHVEQVATTVGSRLR